MASRREQNMKYRRYSGRVNGNLAYDPAYEERQRRLRREREYEREHERQREEFMRPPQRKVQKKAAPVRRQREKVSLGTLCGFMALAAMVALMIMCRAQLTEISAQVVSVQKEISALEDEHVRPPSKRCVPLEKFSRVYVLRRKAGGNKAALRQKFPVRVFRRRTGNFQTH